jgi:hypothetical protein
MEYQFSTDIAREESEKGRGLLRGDTFKQRHTPRPRGPNPIGNSQARKETRLGTIRGASGQAHPIQQKGSCAARLPVGSRLHSALAPGPGLAASKRPLPGLEIRQASKRFQDAGGVRGWLHCFSGPRRLRELAREDRANVTSAMSDALV